jgi:hypothetical protein
MAKKHLVSAGTTAMAISKFVSADLRKPRSSHRDVTPLNAIMRRRIHRIEMDNREKNHDPGRGVPKGSCDQEVVFVKEVAAAETRVSGLSAAAGGTSDEQAV